MIKDFRKELPLFKIVTDNCKKIAKFCNSKSEIRNNFRKFQSHEFEGYDLLRVPLPKCDNMKDFAPLIAKLERRDFCSEEEKDTELFAMASGPSGMDDMLDEVFAAPSV